MTADTQATDTSDKPDDDSPWKKALERFFPEFLALLFPAIDEQIDWSVAPEFLDKELQQIGGNSPRGRRYADKLARVQAKDGSTCGCSPISKSKATRRTTLARGCFSTGPACVIATKPMLSALPS